MRNTKTIQICGTGSGVGKSVLVTALCRIFLQDGFRVCPFKAQNMALNSFVTKDNKEMGRAQVTQAQACRINPSADMNPILIKPTSDKGAQITVQGKPIGNMNARQYQNKKSKDKLFKNVKESFNRLKNEFELIVLEGAGSPAEINLKQHDIVNLRMARYAKAPIILVGDIDKGGVFASLVGTLELLNEKEREMVKGFVINKFRGDKNLLKSAVRFLEKKTKKPVLGIVPYFSGDIKIPEEDSVAIESRMRNAECGMRNTQGIGQDKRINIAVVKLPHISNFTDFDALEKEPDVRLSYISSKEELNGANVVIIPGTKNTIEDLIWLRKTGLAEKIVSTQIIGICGGYQMLGKAIYDPNGIESTKKEINGLGFLPIATELKLEKTLTQTNAVDISTKTQVTGYEIHHGKTTCLENLNPMFEIKGKNCFDGAVSNDRRVWGTYLHGIFDNDDFRNNFLNGLRSKLGIKKLPLKKDNFNLDKEFDKLARLVRKNININLLYKIINKRGQATF